jgi:hypothetical protein
LIAQIFFWKFLFCRRHLILQDNDFIHIQISDRQNINIQNANIQFANIQRCWFKLPNAIFVKFAS